MATCVLSVDLAEEQKDQPGLSNYNQALVLVRLHGLPLGKVVVPCEKGILRATDLWSAIEVNGELCWNLTQNSLKGWLLQNHPTPPQSLPSWTIVICSRDRTDDLRYCLEGLRDLDTTNGEILVVDNAPSDDLTAKLVAQYPNVRYTRENRPGLNWARTHGAQVATGDIVIYTDDDVVIDANWVKEILEPYSNPRVAAVTGLTMPFELENNVQELFEFNYGGFSKGFYRKVFDYTNLQPAYADKAGAGANMSFRREIVNRLGLFAVELDCGTIAKTGGDLYGMYLVLSEGYQIVYNPAALVWHRHRRDYQNLRKTLGNYRIGGMAYLTRCLVQHGDWQALKVGYHWFRYDLSRLKRALKKEPDHLPIDLILAQIKGIPIGIRSYFLTRKLEKQQQPSHNFTAPSHKHRSKDLVLEA